MITSTLCLSTGRAEDYLAQLCAHFAKRVPVDATAARALVTLPIGICELTASATGLSARIEADVANIDRMEEVFGGWIERLAFREQPNIGWQRVAPRCECQT